MRLRSAVGSGKATGLHANERHGDTETILTETRADRIEQSAVTDGKPVQIGEVEVQLSIERLS